MTIEATCINLFETFGDKYAVAWDGARKGKERDPWLLIVPCKNGHISPHGGRLLAVYLSNRSNTVARIKREVASAKPHQQGDREASILFDVKDFDQVAAIVGARRKRKLNLTDEQRRAIGDRLKNGRDRKSANPDEPTEDDCEDEPETEDETEQESPDDKQSE